MMIDDVCPGKGDPAEPLLPAWPTYGWCPAGSRGTDVKCHVEVSEGGPVPA